VVKAAMKGEKTTEAIAAIINIKLLVENMTLHFDNKKHSEKLKDLKRLERWCKGTEPSKESGGFSIAKQKVN
jgi:hypothetical protein